MKKKQIRAIAIAAIALVFLGLGIAQLKIEPAENSVPSTSPGTLSDKPDDKQPELFDDAQQPDETSLLKLKAQIRLSSLPGLSSRNKRSSPL